MTLQEKIQNDWKEALKNRAPAKDVLSLIQNELKNRAIADRSQSHSTKVEDEVAIEVLLKMSKQRKEAIEQFSGANRQDLVEKESFELSLIETYLPKALTTEELKKLIEEAINETQAKTIKEMGKVMSSVIAKAKGRADGKQIQILVSEMLK